MKTYKILVTTTFRKVYEVEANSRDEAEDLVIDQLDTATDTSDFDTDLEHIEHH